MMVGFGSGGQAVPRALEQPPQPRRLQGRLDRQRRGRADAGKSQQSLTLVLGLANPFEIGQRFRPNRFGQPRSSRKAEDASVVPQLHGVHGNKWTEIAARMPVRPRETHASCSVTLLFRLCFP